MSIPTWTLGDRLRKALDHAGLSVSAMSEEVGVSRATTSNWMHGRTRPPRSALVVWAMRTGVPLEWILEGRVPEPRQPAARLLPHLDSNQKPAVFCIPRPGLAA